GVDDAAQKPAADGHALARRAADDVVAAADALKLAERHQQRDVVAEADDLGRNGRSARDPDVAEGADRQRQPLGLDDEPDRLPHAAADPGGFEIGQELDAVVQAHPSSPRSIWSS